MKTITLLSLFSLLFISNQLFAQSEGNTKTVPFQLTLLTPLGTNGTNSGNTINRVSINILAGYHAGLKGVEFGGMANLNRDFVDGAQFAGLANYTGGTAKGVQFAGISNVNLDHSDVAQFAGIANVNTASSNGFQGAGIANFTLGHSNAFQGAGIGNIAYDLRGLQLGGVTNLALGYVNGAQLGGVINYSQSIKGAQIAGVTNISEYVDGAQISGVLNVARTVDGVQLGLLNIADTVKNGIPIGLLSIVREGYREFEVGFSEGLNTYGSFKIGVDAFYNIFSVGTQFLSDQFRWGIGYGIGTHLTKREDFKVNLELMSYQINEGSTWTEGYNGLQQLKLTFAGGINPNVMFFAGPTFNLMVSDYVNEKGEIGSGFPPYYITNSRSGNTNLKFWVGFSAGLRIH